MRPSQHYAQQASTCLQPHLIEEGLAGEGVLQGWNSHSAGRKVRVGLLLGAGRWRGGRAGGMVGAMPSGRHSGVV